MLFPATEWLSPEEYVEIGNLVALARRQLTLALTYEVSSRLKSPFRGFGVGFRIFVEATGVMLYPRLVDPASVKSTTAFPNKSCSRI